MIAGAELNLKDAKTCPMDKNRSINVKENTKMKVVPALPILMSLSGDAFAQGTIREAQVGLLSCEVEGGTGLIIGSPKSLVCVLERSDGLPNETYSGVISKFGIMGKTRASKIAWAVFAPSNAVEISGRLAGNYGGISGEVTVGVGLGTNADRRFLQIDRAATAQPSDPDRRQYSSGSLKPDAGERTVMRRVARRRAFRTSNMG
ncbi:DUF992 domain-containing protein [Roseibium aggregatum]|uniref:DUF992 domain-containing protein n=1 Tax=Roseibium aggregatum TaxID=187304 RepID=UPI0025AD879A|nr:DUF992 domain-containing protein [Roseibium aggregatum]WJS05805.1 DUF992 domain-containing protein [Roseibium aggregatum]